jgi:DNA-binding CsgD family transcriptional regulator
VAGLPLLERERELARVSELVEGAAAGEFGFALVEGPAGAGKSAILAAVASSAGERGLTVLRAVGLELERDYPFGVARQLFEPAVQGLDGEARSKVFAGAAALAEPLLAGRGTESGQLVDPGFALLHSLYWVLVGLTDLAPTAVVVDDIQWADPPSLRFLAFALRRAEELPMLVAAARRDMPAAHHGDALDVALSGPAAVIRPAPLSRGAIGVVLSDAVGRDLSAELVSEAERVTEGNALYVRELAESLRLAAMRAGEDPLVTLQNAAPAAIDRRVQSALARLDEAAQSLARAVAILGDEVPLRLAATLAEIEQESASSAADVLARADILRAGEPLRLRHPLVRQAILEGIGPRARAVMHARAAAALAREGEPPDRAAVHLLQSDPAGDPAAVAMLREAATRAVAQSAPDMAIAALRRALREPPDAADRSLVLKELALAEAQIGSQDAVGHFREAFDSASSLADMADGAVRYAMLLSAQGKPSEAEALIELVQSAIDEPDRRLMLEAELCTLLLNFRLGGARKRLIRATKGLRGQSPAERLLLGLRAFDATYAAAMSAADGRRAIAAALSDGFVLRELGPDSPTYLMLIGALQNVDDADLADAEITAGVAEARRRGAAFGLSITSTMLATRAWKRGQLRRAEADARTAVEIATQMGWLAGFPFPLAYLIEVLNDTGAFAETDRLLDENNLGGPLPRARAVIELVGARGRLRLSQGRVEEGIQDLEDQGLRLEEIGDSPPGLHAFRAKSIVPALMQTGHEEDARQIADDALALTRAFGQPRYIADALRASALAQAGGPDLDQLREAASLYDQIDARIELARTLLDVGSALRRQRQPAAAREPLRRSLDLARSCGAQPLAQRSEHELRASGARPRRDRITGRDALTATEQRVAQLAIEGLTNRQIAEALFVTRKTVKSHLEHIYAKLDIHARGELKRALAEEDQLTPVG